MTVIEPNLVDLDFWHSPEATRDQVFARLRAEKKRVFCPVREGAGFFALTRHADIATASRSPECFSSAPTSTSLDDPPASVMRFAGSIISLDAPRHTQLRRIVARVFAPRVVERFVEEVRRVARTIVDDLTERGPADFVDTVAAPMTLRSMCRILGVPDALHREVAESTDMILVAGDPEYRGEDGADRETTLVRKYRHLHGLMADLSTARRQRPAEDLITRLVTAEVDGESLTTDELGKFFTLLIVAGTETPRNTLSHALDLLTRNPAQRALLLEDLPNRLPAAIEEVIRMATPTTWMRRNVTRDVEISGNTYRRGDRVIMFYNSANRDEAVFEQPHTFDITRSPNPHLGFGAAGPHLCLGAHLARREITVLLHELLTRLPDIHTTAPPVRSRSSFVNGIQHLPCAF